MAMRQHGWRSVNAAMLEDEREVATTAVTPRAQRRRAEPGWLRRMHRDEERSLPSPSPMMRDEAAAREDERAVLAAEPPRRVQLPVSRAELQRLQRDEERDVGELWVAQQRKQAEEDARRRQELAEQARVAHWRMKAAQSPAADQLRAALQSIALLEPEF
eukprot:COSAG06_NODE_13512_length_1250_cov_1.218940_2_plen_159_part_01